MDAELLRIVEERLAASGHEDEAWALLVLASCESTDSLASVLGGQALSRRKRRPPRSQDGGEPLGAYLNSITVEGFRGVGPPKTLEVTPGPGLTLVIGRNGSGKSSFAEALEILMTGANWRWQYRSMIWQEGWRNLHHPSPVVVSAAFGIEGESGVTTLTRSWEDSAELGDSSLKLSLPSRKSTDPATLGWASALESYRPFLSYNELGSMFDEGPTKLHDRLSKILGLGDLDFAGQLLRDARLEREARANAPKKSLPALLGELERIDDDRAKQVIAALGGRKWSLDKAREAIAEDEGGGGGAESVAILRALATLETPSAAEAARLSERLRTAAERLEELVDTDAGRVGDMATILRDALNFHERHGDVDCPVCGTRKLFTRSGARWPPKSSRTSKPATPSGAPPRTKARRLYEKSTDC